MRPAIAHISKKFGDHSDALLFGAEIGVYQGDHAEEILNALKPDLLYLIDPWNAYETDGRYGDWMKRVRGERAFEKWKNKDWDAIHLGVCERFTGREDVVVYRIKSEDIGSVISRGVPDFIYIDGSHEYEQVLRDLRNAWTLIRPGGVLGGHDYRADTQADVVRAVDEFAAEIGIPVQHAETDFWFDRPEHE